MFALYIHGLDKSKLVEGLLVEFHWWCLLLRPRLLFVQQKKARWFGWPGHWDVSRYRHDCLRIHIFNNIVLLQRNWRLILLPDHKFVVIMFLTRFSMFNVYQHYAYFIRCASLIPNLFTLSIQTLTVF